MHPLVTAPAEFYTLDNEGLKLLNVMPGIPLYHAARELNVLIDTVMNLLRLVESNEHTAAAYELLRLAEGLGLSIEKALSESGHELPESP